MKGTDIKDTFRHRQQKLTIRASPKTWGTIPLRYHHRYPCNLNVGCSVFRLFFAMHLDRHAIRCVFQPTSTHSEQSCRTFFGHVPAFSAGSGDLSGRNGILIDVSIPNVLREVLYAAHTGRPDCWDQNSGDDLKVFISW